MKLPRAPAAGAPPRRIALALGGGGARGLAHIAVLEALDEIGVRPVAIAGTSIGALVGAAYAAGRTGKELRRHVITLAHDRPETLRRLLAARVGSLGNFFSATFGNPMLVDAGKICEHFMPDGLPDDFGALTVPLTVVATDLYGRNEALFTKGPLRPALAASMAVPGLIRPVEIDGRILVDGGAINPLPFEHLRGKADLVLAVDISGGPGEARDGVPDPFETLFATLQVMGFAILSEKLRHWSPDIIVRPKVGSFRLLDFFHASAILRAADGIKGEVQAKVSALLAG